VAFPKPIAGLQPHLVDHVLAETGAPLRGLHREVRLQPDQHHVEKRT
jgi:hypothetical protein